MAHLGGFDASKVDPAGDFTPIPAGKYLAIMTESAFKQTKGGDGEFLECKWKIAEGQHKGRVIVSRLNLRNRSETAVKIAEGELSAICRAVGVLKPNDSSDLHNVPVELTVGVTNPDDKNRVYNEVTAYAKRGNAQAANEAPAPVGNKASAPAPAGARPSWMGAGATA